MTKNYYPGRYAEMRALAAEFSSLLIRLGIDEFKIEERETNDKKEIIALEVIFPIVDANNESETINARLSIDGDPEIGSFFICGKEDGE